MGKDPDAIREELAQTRAEMTETVGAIGYKADVPSRAKEAVADKVDAARSTVSQATSRAKAAVAGTTSRAGEGDVRRRARRAAGLAQENPLGLAIGAVAIGFLAGLAAPSTRVEDERLGPVADQVRDKVRETGQEALQRGQEVARDTAASAAATARQRGREHGQDVAAGARRRAGEARDQVR
jgi:ElaB/YqjD/DUF883 family membrane-anchored ribosome-binding protein